MGLVSQEAATQKALLRASIRARRRDRSEAEREAAGQAIAERVVNLSALHGVSTVAITVSLPTEPPTAPLIAALLAKGIRVVVPQSKPDGLLTWIAIDGSTTWQIGAHGISEPVGDGEVLDAPVVIVPALAVTPNGTRLGQGGGYFDRALEHSSALTIACVFDDEVIDDLPAEDHDLRVRMIVTPTRVLPVL